jgi:hypothetical protein
MLRGDLDAIVLMALRKDPAHSAMRRSARWPTTSVAIWRSNPSRRGKGTCATTPPASCSGNALAAGLGAMARADPDPAGCCWRCGRPSRRRQQRDLARVEAEKATAVARLPDRACCAVPTRCTPTAPFRLRATCWIPPSTRIDEQADMSVEVRTSLLNTMGSAPIAALGTGRGSRVSCTSEHWQDIGGIDAIPRLQDSVHCSGLILSKTSLGKFDAAVELARRRLDLLELHGFDDASLASLGAGCIRQCAVLSSNASMKP